MDPNQGMPNNWTLPQPVSPESVPTLAVEPGASEGYVSAPELLSPPQAPGTPISSPLQPPVVAPSPTPLSVPRNNTASSPGPQASDADLIEKEWVAKAKQIVEATQEDPFQQTKQMANIKAAYIQQRYHKTIKVAEE